MQAHHTQIRMHPSSSSVRMAFVRYIMNKTSFSTTRKERWGTRGERVGLVALPISVGKRHPQTNVCANTNLDFQHDTATEHHDSLCRTKVVRQPSHARNRNDRPRVHSCSSGSAHKHSCTLHHGPDNAGIDLLKFLHEIASLLTAPDSSETFYDFNQK